MIWTDDNIDQLKTLWIDKGMTATQVASRMKITRSSVMGKVYRLGLVRSPDITRENRKKMTPGQIYANNKRQAKITIRQMINLTETTKTMTPFAEIGPRRCVWIVNANSPALCCGGEVKEGSVYCDEHHARAYRGTAKIDNLYEAG